MGKNFDWERLNLYRGFLRTLCHRLESFQTLFRFINEQWAGILRTYYPDSPHLDRYESYANDLFDAMLEHLQQELQKTIGTSVADSRGGSRPGSGDSSRPGSRHSSQQDSPPSKPPRPPYRPSRGPAASSSSSP